MILSESPSKTAGVDEAGRGPLAGSLFVAACLFLKKTDIVGLDDSKRLTRAKRNNLYEALMDHSDTVTSIVEISVEEIDELNILQATMLGMQRAVKQLSIKPDHVYIDGNRAPELDISTSTIIGGDRIVPSISAASILAKEARDRYMEELDQQFPQYEFKKNKGYPTKRHLELLCEYGPCVKHRKTFAPVRRCL